MAVVVQVAVSLTCPLIQSKEMHVFFRFSFSDHAVPENSGGRQSSRGTQRDGGNSAVCTDRQTPAEADLERQVTHAHERCSTVSHILKYLHNLS